MSGFVCLYTGPPDQCQECGGFDPTGTSFCSHNCRESRAAHVARMRQQEQADRAAVDAYGEAVARLRDEGKTYEEIDRLLAHMPG